MEFTSEEQYSAWLNNFLHPQERENIVPPCGIGRWDLKDKKKVTLTFSETEVIP